MLLQDLLRLLCLRCGSFSGKTRQWAPIASLRVFVSLLLRRLRDRAYPCSTLSEPTEVKFCDNYGPTACYSSVPSSTSRPSQHTSNTTVEILAPPSSESHPSSRPASLRTVGSYRPRYGEEEMKIRARAISASQREERTVARQGSRVAIASRPHSRTSNVSVHSSHPSSPVRILQSADQLPLPSGSRSATPVSPHHPRDMYPVQASLPSGEARTYGTGTLSSGLSPSRRNDLTLEIVSVDVQLAVQPPSQPTSPSSSQLRSVDTDNALSPTYTLPSTRNFGFQVDNPSIGGRMSPQLPQLPPDRWLLEITPKDLLWYTRRAATEKRHLDYELTPLTTRFPHQVPEGKMPVESLGAWMPFTHPEGSLYFLHQDKKIWTNAYMYEQLYHDEVEECVAYLEECRQMFLGNGTSIPAECELVIDIVTSKYDEDALSWCYYYVDHATRSIFWLRRRLLWKEIEDVKGAFSPDHIYHRIEQFYWHHVFHFPEGQRDVTRHFGPRVWRKLLSSIDFDCLDGIMSPRSTSFFPPAELTRMKQMVQVAYEQSLDDALLPEQLSAVSRIQMLRAEQRFINAHGQPFARLDNTDSIYPDADGRRVTWIFRAVNLLLLHAPSVFLADIHSVTVDDIILEYAWRRYFQRLLDDWDRLVLQGAVVLTANVSFLAIPDVIHFPDQPSGTGGDSSIQAWVKPMYTWSASLSYISTLLALGCVMAGLLLARHNRPQIEHSTDASTASRYLERRHSHLFGLEPIAVVYSLPYALMIWGIGFFLAAILSFTFDSTDAATRSIVGIGACVVTSLLLWSICSGKVMLMRRIWLPLANTTAVEILADASVQAAEAVVKKKRAAAQKLKSIIGSMKMAATGSKEDADSEKSRQASAHSV